MDKSKKGKYNLTDLDPKTTFERNVFHRDQFAHFLRWTHILKVMGSKYSEKSVIDFGCGNGNLCEVLYRNRRKPKSYFGIDIRDRTITLNRENFSKCEWAEFQADDLVDPKLDYRKLKGDIVCSFEVIEHIGKPNADAFLRNFRKCGKSTATYYLSTPNYDPRVGAAKNHTYDGRVNEFFHDELEELISKRFQIVKKFGTFASMRDYKDLMDEHHQVMFERLKEYYDTNLISVIMAPMFPEQSRNCLWVLERRQNGDTLEE